MSANQACFPIAAMARVLGVSKAGYYAWLQRPPSARATADAALLKRIKTVHASSRQTYGAPRVHADLHGHGERHSRKRIARLMREAGLVGASHRHGGPTTTRRNKDDRPAPDLVDRDFNAAGPNQLWVADITYVPTMAGFLYLAEDETGCTSCRSTCPRRRLPSCLRCRRAWRDRFHAIRHRVLAADHRRRTSRRTRTAAGQTDAIAKPAVLTGW